MNRFIGANISKLNTNEKGELLKRYVGSASEKNNHTVKIERVETRTMEDVVESSDTLVVNLNESPTPETISGLVKENTTTVFLFPTEEAQLDALVFLRTSKSNLETRQLFFDKTERKDKESDVEENIQFGLISGKVKVYAGKLKIHNGEMENLKNVVDQVTAPGGKIASITDPDLALIQVHKVMSQDVTYLCLGAEQVKICKKKFGQDIVEVKSTVEMEERTEEELTVEEKETLEETLESTAAEGSESSDEDVPEESKFVKDLGTNNNVKDDAYTFSEEIPGTPQQPLKKYCRLEKNVPDPECPSGACAHTKYRCDHCGLACCSPCAQYEGDDLAKGHGDVRNHMPGDSRCKKKA